MSSKFSARAHLRAQLTVSLDHPANMTSPQLGAVLSRWLSGDVPDAKREMYLDWVGLLLEALEEPSLEISGSAGEFSTATLARYYHGILAELEYDGPFLTSQRVILAELVHDLINGKTVLCKR